MKEIAIQRQIQIELSSADLKLWRNNVGQGWQGTAFAVRYGQLISGEARRVHYGLTIGASDLIGLHSVIVTPEMVGQRLAVFVGLEVKSRTGRPTDEQIAFIGMVQELGGLAAIVRSVTEAQEALDL